MTRAWAKRPRIALTCGFQVGHSSVVVELDLLHWKLSAEIGRAYANVALGPLRVSLCSPGGFMEQIPDGDAAQNLYDDAVISRELLSAILEADARGQGLPFREAMEAAGRHLAKELWESSEAEERQP